MNGIVAAAQDAHSNPIPMGLLPLGTANDLMVNLGIPTDIPDAAKVIAAGYTRRIDLGVVIAWDISKKIQKKRYFDNNSAIGLEPNVTLTQQKITWLRGSIRYIVATLIAVAKNPQWKMQLQWEGGEYNGPVTLVTVGNNPLTGGVFYMAPHADPYDGKLNCVYGSVPSRIQILRILPRTMKPGAGNYVEHPSIHEINVSWVKIHTDRPTPLHADGEIQFEATQDIEYQILTDYLPVLMYGAAK
jgi:diacylglycerol kinase (ATP)